MMAEYKVAPQTKVTMHRV